MIIGAELANIGVTERGEENIRAKVDEASSDISRTYMQEMKPHLDFERFEGIFNLIHSNILTRRELKEICREFNKQKTCENKNCKQCEKTHAFCNLYKLGLLGAVLADMGSGKKVQKFLGSGERVFESKILPYSKYYTIHPILNSVIYERSTRIDRAPYYINPEIVVGDGYSWIDPRIYGTNRYCSFINRVCKTERFLDKHGVFLASSYTNKDFIEVLSEKFGKRNLSLEIDKWMKREDSGTGRIFCDEVCPKAFRNLWMIAEVSDFNPNVFFECGFAIGLGRTVTFLFDENAGMIKSKFGKLYLRYKTIDDIIT